MTETQLNRAGQGGRITAASERRAGESGGPTRSTYPQSRIQSGTCRQAEPDPDHHQPAHRSGRAISWRRIIRTRRSAAIRRRPFAKS